MRKQEKHGRGLGRRREKENLHTRPPFSDLSICRQMQNSDWLTLTVGRMGIELVKTNLLLRA